MSRQEKLASKEDERPLLTVREACLGDITAVAAGVGALLEEIEVASPGRSSIEATARAVIADRDLGCVVVGAVGETIVGVHSASWQTALHVGGRYAFIQDLWVAPAWRRKGLATKMMSAMFEQARAHGIARVEVSLPAVRWADTSAADAFYVRNAFKSVGRQWLRREFATNKLR